MGWGLRPWLMGELEFRRCRGPRMGSALLARGLPSSCGQESLLTRSGGSWRVTGGS